MKKIRKKTNKNESFSFWVHLLYDVSTNNHMDFLSTRILRLGIPWLLMYGMYRLVHSISVDILNVGLKYKNKNKKVLGPLMFLMKGEMIH